MIRSSLVALVISIGGLPALASPVDPEVHKLCIEANDYIGCVKTLSGGVKIEKDDGLKSLRAAMKQVSARLSSGTSLRDSSMIFQPVIDQLALVEDDYSTSLAVKASNKASILFDIIQSAWQGRIDTLSVQDYGRNMYSCGPTQRGIDQINEVVGSTAVLQYSVKEKNNQRLTDNALAVMFSGGGCSEATVKHNERLMISFVIGVLKEGAVDPSLIEKYEADRAEKIRLANMEAWEIYLERNPGTKAWAAANPAMAEKERIKYNEENPIEPISIPPYSETLEYLSQFNPPL